MLYPEHISHPSLFRWKCCTVENALLRLCVAQLGNMSFSNYHYAASVEIKSAQGIGKVTVRQNGSIVWLHIQLITIQFEFVDLLLLIYRNTVQLNSIQKRYFPSSFLMQTHGGVLLLNTKNRENQLIDTQISINLNLHEFVLNKPVLKLKSFSFFLLYLSKIQTKKKCWMHTPSTDKKKYGVYRKLLEI